MPDLERSGFDPGFRFYRDDPQARPYPTLGEQHREVLTEVRMRERLYPSRVTAGRMTRDEGDRELRVMRSIAHALTPLANREPVEPRATWTEQVHCLRREIAMRRTFYPRFVANRQLTQEDADHRLALLEGTHAMWWYEDRRDEAREARNTVVRAAA